MTKAAASQNTDVMILTFNTDAVDTGSVWVKYPWLAYMVL